MTAPPGPPLAAHEAHPPRPISLLRQLATAKLDGIPPSEFAIKLWITTAKDSFTKADYHAGLARQARANHRHAEQAYIEYRQAGQVMDKITKHPGYPKLKADHPTEYFAYQALRQVSRNSSLELLKCQGELNANWSNMLVDQLTLESVKKQTELVKMIEDRYAQYQNSQASQPPQSTRPTHPPTKLEQGTKISSLSNGYSVDSYVTQPQF